MRGVLVPGADAAVCAETAMALKASTAAARVDRVLFMVIFSLGVDGLRDAPRHNADLASVGDAPSLLAGKAA
jgi:uncharacterized protein YhaN